MSGGPGDRAAVVDGRIRPYSITGGRTRSTVDLPVETVVLASVAVTRSARSAAPEARRIVALAAEPISIAELAARLDMVLGVVRVLVGDLIEQGVLYRNSATGAREAHRDVDVLERVRDGLRNLR